MATTAPTPELLDALREAAGPGGWEEAGGDSPYLAEPRDLLQGRAALVLKPDSTEATARIVTLCAEARVGIVPYAGGTGLVGGQTATEPPDPVVLSVERMRRVRSVEPDNGALTAEAGCTLAEIRTAAAEQGCLFPLRIASEGDCRIGGNLATNAGGAQVLRYGSARDLCFGLEAVFADGQIWDGLGALRKNNTGYDLRHLLIGSEGTLGVITAATLRLHPAPAEEATALAAVPDLEAAAEFARRLRDSLGEILSIAELIDQTGVEFVRAHFAGIDTPLERDHPWYVLAETEGGEESHARERLERVLAAAFEDGIVTDAALAGSIAQRESIRTLRETIPLANRRVGAVATHDVSVPVGRVAELATELRAAVAAIDGRLRMNVFGHLGDGNLHANVFPPEGSDRDAFRELRERISGTIFAVTRKLGGSVSAEHGVGRLRKTAAFEAEPPARLAAMRAIKRALDPQGILNPGAVVGPEDGDCR